MVNPICVLKYIKCKTENHRSVNKWISVGFVGKALVK